MTFLTLWLLSVLNFAGGHLLPDNVGRAMLKPFAVQAKVDVLNPEIGTDRPLLVLDEPTTGLDAIVAAEMFS